MKKIFLFCIVLLFIMFTGCQQQTPESDNENRTSTINGFTISLSGDSGTLDTRTEPRNWNGNAFTATVFIVSYAAKDVTKSWTITVSSEKFPLYVHGLRIAPGATYYMKKCDSLKYTMTVFDENGNPFLYDLSTSMGARDIIVNKSISKIVYDFNIVNAHGEFLDRNPDKYSDVNFFDMFYFYSETDGPI